MDPHLPAALAKRLAAYSATAGVTLAVAPTAVSQGILTDPDRTITGSEVIYHEVDPAITLNTPGYGTNYLHQDIDLDSVDDLSLFGCYRYGACPGYFRGADYRVGFTLPDGAPTQNGVLGCNEGVSRLSSGEVIGPAATGCDFNTSAIAAWQGYNGSGGPFLGEEGYAGFRFIAGDGELHYGWIRLRVQDDALQTWVYGYAYEAKPETPIIAGDTSTYTPEVLLDGTVNQTVFPPEGGTLSFTATVTNTTDEPAELNLWVVARKPGGTLIGYRRLGAGVLPAGATVTRTASTWIPPVAPSGTAQVRFHIGRFPLVMDSEVFSITKEPGAHATEAEGEAAFFADEATSQAAASALAGTHALSAPVPNPSTGRSALTLAVAEAQHVSVTVHDALGRRVAVLHDGALAGGVEHRLAFDGAELPAGVYVVRAVGAAFADTRVLTLAR